ncbi:hypothetical protein EYF80_061224 [Liparis tanakae]|uniref:Uncharacterized protein n=1 Tax=Liparis tanakae TaxID=230148 RepID=A0A4Z2EIP7_9TELE|nr:hypothetical protein EYF80_061224 [Liparis tanakae]
MPRLNGSLRLPRRAAGSAHRSAVRSAVAVVTDASMKRDFGRLDVHAVSIHWDDEVGVASSSRDHSPSSSSM